MKVLAVILISFLFSAISNAQVKYSDFVHEVHNDNHSAVYTKKAVNVEGNPYLLEDWAKGTIRFQGMVTEPLNIKYNVAENAFEVNNGQETIIVEGASLKEVHLTEPNEVILKSGFKTFGEKDLTANTFFEVIYEGENISLLRKEGASLQKNVASYGTATTQHRYSRYTDYYISTPDDFKEIKLRERNILRLFSDNKKQIKNYMRDNKLSIKRDNDLKEILAYAENL